MSSNYKEWYDRNKEKTREKKRIAMRKYGGDAMAYFSNGSEGTCFDMECASCRFGDDACPIAEVQFCYNYDAANNDVATMILGALVKDNGECSMLRRFPELRAAECKEGVMEEEVDYKLAYEKRGEVLKNMENEIYRLVEKISSLYKIIEVLKKDG